MLGIGTQAKILGVFIGNFGFESDGEVEKRGAVLLIGFNCLAKETPFSES
jgi:hypothetical protein